MGTLSPHFDRSEFACRCLCGQNQVDYELIMVLEWLRVKTGAAVTVTSGNRCTLHNEKVQHEANPFYVPYSSRSNHMYSIAADIKVKGYSPQLIYNILDEKFPGKYGLKAYSSWVHIDVRYGHWRGK